MAVAKVDESYYLVPKPVAEKIMQRSQDFIIVLNDKVDEIDEEDPYSEYQIPDDLMW